MSIREVINMLTVIFNFIMENFGDIFAGLGFGGTEEAPEEEVVA